MMRVMMTKTLCFNKLKTDEAAMQQSTLAVARSACALLITIITIILSSKALAAAIALPTTYDNAGNTNEAWGQTFVPQLQNAGYVSGVRFYIGDPTRPGDFQVNELEGAADLVLFDVSNPNSVLELGRTQVQGPAGLSSGLTTFSFSSSIAVNPGVSYFIGLDTQDDLA